MANRQETGDFPQILRVVDERGRRQISGRSRLQVESTRAREVCVSKDVLPLLLPTVYAMGARDPLAQPRLESRKEIIGNNSVEWLLNDGVVNTISMRGPRGEDVIREVESDGFPLAESSAADVRGKYWHFGTTDYLDHADEIGVWITEETVGLRELLELKCATDRYLGSRSEDDV